MSRGRTQRSVPLGAWPIRAIAGDGGELIHRPVAVLAAMSTPAALAAKAATTTVPAAFTTATNPVELGLVASLSRPGGNITGATQLNVEVGPKRLELVRELIPTATIVGLLVNPTNPAARTLSRGLEAAARTLGLQLDVLQASTERDIDDAFATVVQRRTSALVIVADVPQQPEPTARRADAPPRGPYHFPISRVRRCRRPDELQWQ